MKSKHCIYVRENRKNKNRAFWTELKQGALSKSIGQNSNTFPQRMTKRDFDNFTAVKSQQVRVIRSLLFKYYVINKKLLC